MWGPITAIVTLLIAELVARRKESSGSAGGGGTKSGSNSGSGSDSKGSGAVGGLAVEAREVAARLGAHFRTGVCRQFTVVVATSAMKRSAMFAKVIENVIIQRTLFFKPIA